MPRRLALGGGILDRANLETNTSGFTRDFGILGELGLNADRMIRRGRAMRFIILAMKAHSACDDGASH